MSHIKAMTQQAAESARYGDKANEAYCISEASAYLSETASEDLTALAQCDDPALRQLARQEQAARDLHARLAEFCEYHKFHFHNDGVRRYTDTY